MNTELVFERYETQLINWPDQGNHILAQHNNESVVVYQAYGPDIGKYVIENGEFGGKFCYDRMTWIKTNFLWMMYRSGWGQKKGQEFVFAIHLRRKFFDKVLRSAVSSIYTESNFKNKNMWKNNLSKSPVRVQWDPDRNPDGTGVQRRAIQLGLKGKIVKEYVHEGIIKIEDISKFVGDQYNKVRRRNYASIMTPRETIYLPENDLSNYINISKK